MSCMLRQASALQLQTVGAGRADAGCGSRHSAACLSREAVLDTSWSMKDAKHAAGGSLAPAGTGHCSSSLTQLSAAAQEGCGQL